MCVLFLCDPVRVPASLLESDRYYREGALYSVQCTVWSVQCTVYSVQCTVNSIQCTVYSVQHTAYSLQLTLYSVQFAVCSVQSCKKLYFCESHYFRDWDWQGKTRKLQQNFNRDKIAYITNLTQMLSISFFWQVVHEIYMIFSCYLQHLHDIHGISMIFSMICVICTFRTNFCKKLDKFAGKQDKFAD